MHNGYIPNREVSYPLGVLVIELQRPVVIGWIVLEVGDRAMGPAARGRSA